MSGAGISTQQILPFASVEGIGTPFPGVVLIPARSGLATKARLLSSVVSRVRICQ